MSNSDGAGRAPDGVVAGDAAEATAVESPAVAMFARKLAHDLNNFATVVRTYSELLLTELPAGSTREDVTEIHRAADAMVMYLQRVSRFARANALRPATVPVLAAVREIVDEFAEARDAAPVVLQGETAAMITADPHWLRDVLRELVRNAREAAPAGTEVRVVLTERQDADGQAWLVADVRDQGTGFADEVATNAEDPFVTTKSGVRGAGFGLTLASAFARASHGRLVRSRDGDTTSVALWLRRHEG